MGSGDGDAEEISTLDLLSFLKTVNIVLTGGVHDCRHVSSRAMSEENHWRVASPLPSCTEHCTFSGAIRIVSVSVTPSLSLNLAPVGRSKWLRQNVEYVKHETLYLAAALGIEYSELFAKARIARGTRGSTYGVETPESPNEAVQWALGDVAHERAATERVYGRWHNVTARATYVCSVFSFQVSFRSKPCACAVWLSVLLTKIARLSSLLFSGHWTALKGNRVPASLL